MTAEPGRSVGDLLRAWRQRRRMSQLEFALEAEVSQRHISFIESGRSTPSREMLLHLAERLDIPLRERNALLLVGGYAPIFPERALDDPALDPARRAIEVMLKSHEPFPALAIDRQWNLVSANRAIAPLLEGVRDPALLKPPVNVLRLSLHPDGLAPRIANLHEWRSHLLDRLRHQIAISGDPVLFQLKEEFVRYPSGGPPPAQPSESAFAGFIVPFELNTDRGLLSFFSTTTVFGTPLDITLAELAMESFFPANAATADIMRQLEGERAKSEPQKPA